MGIYALCRLGKWVTFEDIRGLQAKSLEDMPLQKRIVHEPVKASTDEWWRPAAIYDDRTDRGREVRKQKSAKIDNFHQCLKTLANTTPRTAPVIEELPPKDAQSQAPSTFDGMVNEPIPQGMSQEPEEVLDIVRAQYQEALYVSKVKKFSERICTTRADYTRHRWHTLQKAPYHELEQSSEGALVHRPMLSVWCSLYGLTYYLLLSWTRSIGKLCPI